MPSTCHQHEIRWHLQLLGVTSIRVTYKIFFIFSRQTLAATAATELMPLIEKADEYDVIGVDEGQFVSLYKQTKLQYTHGAPHTTLRSPT